MENKTFKVNNRPVTNRDGYKIESVEVSSNGHNHLLFDVKWSGDTTDFDCPELRIVDDKGEYLTFDIYPAYTHQIKLLRYFLKVSAKGVYQRRYFVEFGQSEYDDNGNEKKWDVLAKYGPIDLNIYYEPRLLRRSVLKIV